LKNILIKGIILAVVLLFLVRGGVGVLILGWKFFVPLLAVTIVYFAIRKVMKSKNLGKKADPGSLGSQSLPEQVIVICPLCNKPKGSCPECS